MSGEKDIAAFLGRAGWAGAVRAAFPADFSTRRYARLTRGNETAILMQAEPDQKTESFVALAGLLRGLGLPAPEILASDVPAGLVLMEDFGEAQGGKLLDSGKDRGALDKAAAHTLARLHEAFREVCPSLRGGAADEAIQSQTGRTWFQETLDCRASLPARTPEGSLAMTNFSGLSLPVFDAPLFVEQLAPFLDHYFPARFLRPASEAERRAFNESWRRVLAPFDRRPRTLLLRDFMPDNVMLLADGRLGLLDFQDAGLGPAAYDIGSWCEEVRREGGHGRLKEFIESYIALRPDADPQALWEDSRVLLAQRYTRLLGNLMKLDRRSLIPRVWKALNGLLKDEKLAPVLRWFTSALPS